MAISNIMHERDKIVEQLYVQRSKRLSKEKCQWPPTPQNILEQKNINTGNNTSFNITPSIVSPNSTFNENGTVKLYKGKATKVSKICDDIETLIPNQNRLSRKCYYY